MWPNRLWRFVRRLWERLSGSRDTRLTRFIFSQSDFNAAKKLIRHRIFMPRKDGAVSVFNIDNLNEGRVWAIGTNLAHGRGQNLHARADIDIQSVIIHGLRVVPDEPPPRHRNIVGWPSSEQKEDQKLIAMELAAVARLFLP